MFDRKAIKIVLLVLLIISLLTIGASAGWSQGFVAGRMATSSIEGVVTPQLVYGYGMGFTPFLFLGGCLKFGFFLFLVMIIGKMFRFWSWKRYGENPPHMHRWHKGHRTRKYHSHHPTCFHPYKYDKHRSQDVDNDTSQDVEKPLDDTIRQA